MRSHHNDAVAVRAAPLQRAQHPRALVPVEDAPSEHEGRFEATSSSVHPSITAWAPQLSSSLTSAPLTISC